MFLSKIQLDPRKRDTARALQNRQLFHAAIESTVEGERPHIIWRLEPDMTLLAVSNEIPYLGDFQAQFGFRGVKPVTQSYDRYLETLAKGELWKFVVEVNPIIHISGSTKNGKDIPLNLKPTPKYSYCAEDWIKKKLEENGATVKQLYDMSHGIIYFSKGGRMNPIFTVRYGGIIYLSDDELFKKAMKTGIGGKKAYGCGLITAVRISGVK